MKKISFLAGSLLLVNLYSCQSTKNTQSVIGKIGNEPIYTNEFTYVYNKNNANTAESYNKESLDEYLKLYTNFRLKVKEAEALGLDTADGFKKELDGYKKQLAQPYFSEKEVIDQFAKQAYERMKQEVNASHILISLTENASPEDTLVAWKKISDIRAKAIKGEDFAKLAKEYSEDPSAKSNGGNLGYFTALQMVYPFEDAAFANEIGSVSQPVKTRFGYHVLKVHDKRPSRGEVKVAHIMVRASEGMSVADSIAAFEKITELHKKLQSGEAWESLVKQFSDDINTRDKGGELQWFGTGRMIPSFEDAAFSLKEIGTYSAPIQTAYGWHIVKLLDKKGLEDYATLESTIRSKVARDRSDVNKKMLISRLMKENSFKENTSNVEKVLALADSSLSTGTWSVKATSDDQKVVLFSIQDTKYTKADFIQYVAANNRPSNVSITPKQLLSNLYTTYKNQSNIEYEENHLAEKHEDYRMLVKEYRDGILLFQLMDDKVWSKAIKDTVGLKEFFANNADKYQWAERANAIVFNVADSASFEKVQKIVQNDLFPAYEPEIEPIRFSKNSDNLSDDNITKLAKLVPYLKSQKELVVKLYGNASSKESLELAQKRALKVQEYLKDKNIDTVKIIFGNYTKPTPKSTDSDHDRKVSFELLSKSAKVLEREFNKKTPLTLQVTEGKFQKGDNEILDQVTWKTGSYTLNKDNRMYLVVVKDVEAPRAKKLEETRGQVISDYQEYLEKQWLKELQSKYAVEIDQEEVNKLTKK
jgi:peptidyl-prolyl cis-trans isomerase SurA